MDPMHNYSDDREEKRDARKNTNGCESLHSSDELERNGGHEDESKRGVGLEAREGVECLGEKSEVAGGEAKLTEDKDGGSEGPADRGRKGCASDVEQSAATAREKLFALDDEGGRAVGEESDDCDGKCAEEDSSVGEATRHRKQAGANECVEQVGGGAKLGGERHVLALAPAGAIAVEQVVRAFATTVVQQSSSLPVSHLLSLLRAHFCPSGAGSESL